MELCGYTYSFFRQLERKAVSTTEVVHFFIELGLRSVELADPYIDATELDPLRDLLTQAGLAVACYDIYGPFGQRDAATRRTQLDDVRRALERAASLGAAHVLVLPGATDDGIAMEAAREWYIEGLCACMPDAQQLGLTVTIANLGAQAALCGASQHIRSIAAAVGPEIRATYDVGNFLMAGEQPVAALDRVADLVVHVHLKDWRIEPPTGTCLELGGYPGLDGRCFHGMPLGDGVVPLKSVIERLRQLGYRGALSVEYEGTDDPRAAVQRGLAYVRTLLTADPVHG